MVFTRLILDLISNVVPRGFPQHVKLARVLQTEIVEDDRPEDQLGCPGLLQVLDLVVHEGEPLTAVVIALPHGPDEVTARSEDSQYLREGAGVDLAGSETIGGHDHVVGLVVDWDGAELLHHGEDVVSEDPLLSGLAQHPQAGVQSVHELVSVLAHLLTQQSSPAGQVQDGDVAVELQLEEGLDTLDVPGVVAHHHQVLVVGVRPVVVELDPVGRVAVVHEDVGDLLLQGGGDLHVHVVGQGPNQALDQVENPGSLGLGVEERLPLDHLEIRTIMKTDRDGERNVTQP